MPIFGKNKATENPKKEMIELLKPYVDYPENVIPKHRKKALLKALDKKIGEHTDENGVLDYQSVLDELYDSCFEENEINGAEYTFLVQVLSFYVYHLVVVEDPLDIKRLAEID
ncbi:conserved hypothetical protein [Methanocaldococcus vulcanius M7]|uniref:Uncharacterized protein n=1 Tax=Methanocaldococcus vulcanius (strain ATCC 700851 / DSM 12094 / M7) TaxID=579137 RepID=C9RFR6_METVM|nr:hypothetical protein [Methanocaldococcus vulcanius]ACX72418.1 conserved hypothetical protein [Methanocaldococcus vulcanius M7]